MLRQRCLDDDRDDPALTAWHQFEWDRYAVGGATLLRLAHGHADGGFVKARADHAWLDQGRANAERCGPPLPGLHFNTLPFRCTP